jgi:hypothetical protein
MSYAKTYTHKVHPVYGDETEEKLEEDEDKEKPPAEEKTGEVDEAYIISNDEINDLVARSGEVTWDEFFSIFDGQVQ